MTLSSFVYVGFVQTPYLDTFKHIGALKPVIPILLSTDTYPLQPATVKSTFMTLMSVDLASALIFYSSILLVRCVFIGYVRGANPENLLLTKISTI